MNFTLYGKHYELKSEELSVFVLVSLCGLEFFHWSCEEARHDQSFRVHKEYTKAKEKLEWGN